jgi:glycolate oxidase
MNAFKLAAQLRAFLPSEAVLHEIEDVRPYECDGLSAYRQLPMVVALPQTEEEVVEIVRVCHAADVPIVARGAGTGLSGGALPLSEGLLLSLAKLKRIPDPSSQIACTIGGNVAENSGGVHCLKYGLTVHNILRLRVVTVEGDILEIGSDGLDAPGYDLLALMSGSEGMLGIVTEVTVKLIPRPEKAQVVLAAFGDIRAAGNAVANVIAAGIIPAGMEMMDQITTRAVEEFIHAGYNLEAAAILLCESDGGAEEVAGEVRRINEIMTKSGAIDIRISRDEVERLRFWAGRKAAFPAAGRISPDYYCMDGTIPRKNLASILSGIEALSAKYGLRCMNVFHAGDGNLHPLILYDANRPGELELTEEFGARILQMCIEAGGTITGEHGVGVEKINQMCAQFKPRELEIFHAVKAAFDPSGLLNPGKAVPTLRRCAEHGAMHVHQGKEKFPELPRF